MKNDRYDALMRAIKVLGAARFKVCVEDGSESPAWKFLARASIKLENEAEAIFRAEVAV